MTGTFSGFRLPGDRDRVCSITAGVDECRLAKVVIQADGRPRIVEQIDPCEEEAILAETCGRIEIRKANDHAGLREALAEVERFLESFKGGEVTWGIH